MKKVKIGEKVIITHRGLHYFEPGEIVTVMKLGADTCMCSNNEYCQYVEYCCISQTNNSLNNNTKVI